MLRTVSNETWRSIALEYKCGKVKLPKDISMYIDKSIQNLDTEDLDEINRRVLDNRFFRNLCS